MSKGLGRWMVLVAITTLLVALLVAGQGLAQTGLTPMEELGKSIFFDENLSINKNQSCASCHDPEWGWTGPRSDFNAHGAVYEGSIAGAFGNRKPPSAAYATLSPIFQQDKKGLWVGGNFWDGRATGEELGNPAADQAQGPFTNPLEQALPDEAAAVTIVCSSGYAGAFKAVWGPDACAGDVSGDYDRIALSIAAYEDSPEVNAFTSRSDLGKLSKEEKKGRALFNGKGKCKLCHPGKGKQALYTDFTFDNLGVPKNPENPVYLYEPEFVDLGLGGFLGDSAEDGKQKVPTLRNVDLRPSGEPNVKDYSHNGYFKSLKGIVHFYNTRDVKEKCPGPYTEAEALAADCWPVPEVDENVNVDELGDLGLTPEEEDAIVAFLKTLSDQAP